MSYSPLHIKIMLHHYSIAEPYSLRDPAHALSRATRAYHQQLVNEDMLVYDPEWHSRYRVTEKGRAYVEALKEVQP